MRYLNKIVFINSAAIKYAEVTVGGNVHFIGTQGVGKSTVLRAILFFYNADGQKLGIKPGQRTYYDYYFPNADSYIIYEVAKETGPFSVLCYKSNGKICFRFFDNEYRRHLFINEQRKAFENWEQIKEQLNKHRISSSNKVDRYEDYRDILYGNNEGKKEFRKYALLESKQYQNIPRTIQNVLLNAELKAEFIKQTIIKSLSDDDVSIDLKIYVHELKGFDSHLRDVNKWLEKDKNGEIAVRKQAELISKLHTALMHLEREKFNLALQLAWTIKHIDSELPLAEHTLAARRTSEDTVLRKLTDLKEVFNGKRDKFLGEIKVLKDRIETAKKKEEAYRQQNITEVVQRVSRKQELLNSRANLLDERQVLSVQFAELTQRFEAILKEMENQHQGFLNLKNAEVNTIHAEFLNYKDEVNKQFNNEVKQIRIDSKNQLELARNAEEEKRKLISTLGNKRSEIKHRRYFDTEISEKKSELTALENNRITYQNQITHCQNQVKTIQTRYDTEIQSSNEHFAMLAEKSNEQIACYKAEIEKIAFKLANSNDSLFGWLNKNYPNWENTIGKVISDDERVLFNTSLKPRMIDTMATFYGVALDLSEVDTNVNTLEEFEKKKDQIANELSELVQRLEDQRDNLANELQKIKDKYLPGIKELKNETSNSNYQLEQSEAKQLKAKLELYDLEQRASTENQHDLQQVDAEIAATADQEVRAREQSLKIEKDIQKAEKEKEKERDKLIEAEKKRVVLLEKSIKNEIEESKRAFGLRATRVKENQYDELKSKGADSMRLQQIETELEACNNELSFIEANIKVVAIYEHEKTELLDRVGEFKAGKETLEKGLALEEEKHAQQKQKLQLNLSALEDDIKQLDSYAVALNTDLTEYNSFTETELYQKIPSFYKEPDERNKTGKNARSIIKDINQAAYTFTNSLNELKDEVTQFTGSFSVDNIFKFKTNFSKTEEYLLFAEELNEFIEENKIERFEKDVNEKFAYIIHTIGKETGNLMSKSGAIQKTITKINNDFVENGSFVAAIRKIELRWVKSANKIVTYLTDIDKFNSENQFLGTGNLFASQNIDKQNKQAIELLRALYKAIVESKKDKISLSDSFELEFRVAENQNDTGWVEKISSVGSDGTDILVKAMINIMLLNVSKGESSRHFKDFKLHCMMDEIGKLHSNNVKGILKFANERNILLINGSPEETNALSYKHIYKLSKDDKSFTKVIRVLTNYNES